MKAKIYSFIMLISVLFTVNLFSNLVYVPDDFTTIQEALDSSLDGDSIVIHPGTYQENLIINEKCLTITSLYYLNQDESYIDQTIVDGNFTGSVLRIENSQSSFFTISGLTLKNGTGTFNMDPIAGGGIYCLNSSLNVLNCKIINCTAAKGGGIYSEYCEVSIFNTLFSENLVPEEQFYGGSICTKHSNYSISESEFLDNTARICGGVIMWWGNISITDCVFSGNKSTCGGSGAISLHNSNGTIENSMFDHNSAIFGTSQSVGGAIYLNEGDFTIINSIIANNTSSIGSGIFIEDEVDLNLLNCTIVDNNGGNGSGLYCNIADFPPVNAKIINSIFWNNGSNEIYIGNGSIDVENSLIQGGETGVAISYGQNNWGVNNINLDPIFDENSELSYMIASNSPCVDGGTTEYPNNIEIPMFDYAGNIRIYGNTIDIGAYESQAVSIEEEMNINNYHCLKNYPNPFTIESKNRNSGTFISFQLSKNSNVNLSIYNMKGQKIRTISEKYYSKGKYSLFWDGKNDSNTKVSSGIYLYKLETEKEVSIKKMIVLK